MTDAAADPNICQIDPPPAMGMNAISCRDLFSRDFASLFWNIEDVLPAGTMLLFGKPKKGKSFLTLLMAISVAAGRPVFGKRTSGRPALYLGLEDSLRRLQRRAIGCARALPIDPQEFQDKLHLSNTARRLGSGLIEELGNWMDTHPGTGLIVVDMLKKITTSDLGKMTLYEQQSLVGEALTRFSHAHPELSALVVHHSRKADSDDPFDLVSGTTGLSGSYDSLAAIADTEGTRVLHVTGRDLEGAEIPLLMNDRGMYTLEMPDLDQAQAETMSDSRRRVFDAVPASMPMSRADILIGCSLDGGTVDQQLRKLKRAGLIKQCGRGLYQKTGKRFFDEPIAGDFF